jgi:hypothetical protein
MRVSELAAGEDALARLTGNNPENAEVKAATSPPPTAQSGERAG